MIARSEAEPARGASLLLLAAIFALALNLRPAMAAVAGASAVSVANNPAGRTRRAAMSMP